MIAPGAAHAGAAVATAALVAFKVRVSPPSVIVSALSFSTATTLAADLDRVRFVVEAVGRELWFGGGASVVGGLPIIGADVAVVGLRRDGSRPWLRC